MKEFQCHMYPLSFCLADGFHHSSGLWIFKVGGMDCPFWGIITILQQMLLGLLPPFDSSLSSKKKKLILTSFCSLLLLFAFVEEIIFGNPRLTYCCWCYLNMSFENLIFTPILWDRYSGRTILEVMKLRLKEIR